jgi:peptidoglycan/LPS O-acetylase OafA/YrhL
LDHPALVGTRARAGDRLAAAGALLLLGTLFLPWYALQDGERTRFVLTAQGRQVPGTGSAWEALGSVLFVLLVLVFAALIVEGLLPAARGRAARVAPRLGLGVLAVATFGVLISRILDPPGGSEVTDPRVGAYLGLVSVLLIAVGACAAAVSSARTSGAERGLGRECERTGDHRGDMHLPDASDAPDAVAPPPGNPRFPLFDSLRAIAALSVVVGHVFHATHTVDNHPGWSWAPRMATEGVAIFFLISGFLLYRPFLAARRGGRPITVRDFSRRRFLRIVPAYWVALTLLLLINWNKGLTIHQWFVFYGFGQIYSQNDVFVGLGIDLGPAWTLCVEVTFYALLPLLAFAGARLSRRNPASFRLDVAIIFGLALASLAFHEWVMANDTNYLWAGTLPGTFLWFALGMLLAVGSVVSESTNAASGLRDFITRRPTVFWLAAVAGFALLNTKVPHPDRTDTGGTAEHVVYGLAALFVLVPAVVGDHAGGFARTVLRWPVLMWIGLVSYGVYLWHTIAIEQVVGRFRDLGVNSVPLVLVFGILVSCLAGALSYYVVERPALRRKNVPLGNVLRRRPVSTKSS